MEKWGSIEKIVAKKKIPNKPINNQNGSPNLCKSVFILSVLICVLCMGRFVQSKIKRNNKIDMTILNIIVLPQSGGENQGGKFKSGKAKIKKKPAKKSQ